MKKCLVLTVTFAAISIANVLHGDVLFFLDEVEFQAALEKAGQIKIGFEDFPWLAPPNSIIGVDDPVDANGSVPGWYSPGMLIDSLSFQSNTGGADSSQVSPAGANGMNLFTTGFLGAAADGLVAGTFVNSIDIISTGNSDFTAMGMTATSFLGGDTVRVDVYDNNNSLIGSLASAPAGINGGFLGILAIDADTIGRVNLFDPGNGAEGIYDISVYVPVPGSLGLLGLVCLLGKRRRRK